MSTDPNTPDTIVLIHGFWVTPRSWRTGLPTTSNGPSRPRARISRLRSRGRGPQRRPDPHRATDGAADHRAPGGRRRTLESPPILMGHSAGGVFTQILMDHGFGAVGVAINSAPTEGVAVVPLSQVRASFPVLKNPANRHRAVGLTLDQWHYAFTNTFSEEETKRLYERYAIPASGHIFWGSAARRTSTRARTTTTSTTTTPTGRRCCSSPAATTTSCRRRSSGETKHYKADGRSSTREGVRGPAPAAGTRSDCERSPTTPSTRRRGRTSQCMSERGEPGIPVSERSPKVEQSGPARSAESGQA